MLSKPARCGACSLLTKGVGYANGSGSGSNNVLLLGEALGAREAQVGAPFVGDAGAQLNRTLQRVQHGREAFRINNVVHCRPPQNWLEGAPWEEDATNNCTTYFHDELDSHPPKVIVPLGNVPTNFLLGKKPHGDGWWGIEDRRGYVYPVTIATPNKTHTMWVVPTYHPSFVMRGNQNLTDVQAIDIKRGLKVAREGFKEPSYWYTEHPNTFALEAFYEDAKSAAMAGKWLAADIETPHSGGATEDEYGSIIDADIIRISFSYDPHHAITIPFTSYNFNWIEAILALPWAYTVFWNQEFDVPRLQSKGLTMGKVLDAMYMWHFLQSDLPKGLGYVSTFFTELSEWKSLSEELPEYYSCKDADATIQCTLRIRDLLVQQGRFDQFIRHYVDLQPYVTTMANSGVLIDPVQQEKFRGEVQKELDRLDALIQAAVPIELKNVKYRKQYPPEFKLGELVARKDEEHWYWDYDRVTGEILERQKFLCTSYKQVLKYIKFRGHPASSDYKTGKETTNAEAIDDLAEQFPDDPLYIYIIEVREFKKIMGQYINGYVPGPDGRVRTHFNRKPSTWRFNSEDPNVQNVLKRSELANEYRKQFVAAPGCVLVELDYKGVEAIIAGFYAGDADYIRAAQLGVHSILMSNQIKEPIDLSWSDDRIKQIAHDLKKRDYTMYDTCKRVVHASNNGSSYRGLRMKHPELFPNMQAAKDLQDLYFNTIAKKIKRWHQKILNEAYEKHYLQNAYGYRHYFWDALHYKGQQLEWGSDAKRALAYMQQSTAAGLTSEAILNIFEKYPEVAKRLRWTIHDSIIAELVDDETLPEYIAIIKSCMETPQPQLGGLKVEVEVAIGKNWGEMEDYKP